VVGGSSGVYEALALHAGGAIVVLTSRLDPATGRELPDWRAVDAAASYPIRRLGLVRPPLPGGASSHALLRHAAWGMRAALLMAAVVRMAWAHRADAVCICDDETVGWLVPFVRHVLRRRALIYCHGDDLVMADPAARRARRRWFGAANAIVAASEFAGRQLTETFRMPASRVVVLPNGVDLHRFRPMQADAALRGRLGIGEDRQVILAPTRLVPRKGVDRLIAALPAIRARHPEVLLLVVGDGPQRAALDDQATEVGGAEALRFAGAVPAVDMPAYYALSSLVVLPNRAEPGEIDGMPLVFLEAGACGKPVIGGRAGGTPEAVEHGRNGLLVDGDDPVAIAAAVLRILDDPVLADQLAAGGLTMARAAGWQARAARFLELCRR